MEMDDERPGPPRGDRVAPPSATTDAQQSVVAPSGAPDIAEAETEGGSSAETGTRSGDVSLSDEQSVYEDEVGVEHVESSLDPRELPNTDYFFFGAFGRGLLMPPFLLNTANFYSGNAAFNAVTGAFFNWRRNGFNFIAEFQYTSLWLDGYFRGAGSEPFQTEFIESRLGMVSGNVLFSWTVADFSSIVALEVGIGLGIGATVGDIYRQEAAPDGAGGYVPCTGVGAPNGLYCEGPVERPSSDGRLDSNRTMGGTYQRTTNQPNPFYFGEGGIPPVLAWIDLPRVALRIKPLRQLQIRAEVGYQIYGFSFGASVAYGL